MTILLEGASHYPPQAIGVGLATFGAFVVALLAVRFIGGARPHSQTKRK